MRNAPPETGEAFPSMGDVTYAHPGQVAQTGRFWGARVSDVG